MYAPQTGEKLHWARHVACYLFNGLIGVPFASPDHAGALTVPALAEARRGHR
jgi:hypothetical protein